MAPLSLKIVLDEGAVTRTLMFDTTTKVWDAHRIVKEKILTLDPDKDYGFFLTSADDDNSGVWLSNDKTLEYYMLRDGDSVQYLTKIRNIRLRMLDGSVKTLQVDESKIIEQLLGYICGKIGITNYEEYGLCREEETQSVEETKSNTGTLTLKRKIKTKDKDVQLEQLSKKLKTDDNVEWLDQHKTLRECGVDTKETLLFKRRLYYSDRNVDSRDPVQLNLLYVQTRDAILNGKQVVTEDKAAEFAGIQCQIQYGDFIEEKHKPGFIENLKEFLPEQYSSSWSVEKKIIKEHRKHNGLSQIEAKHLYTKTARELPTYGVTFFLVKEKQKGKKKLVPRLLGINSESILRLDEETKEILQVWLLTQVKSYRAGSESFTLNFGDYSEKEYAVKTNDAYRIRDILQGYIDIIRKRLAAPYNVSFTEGEAIFEDIVESSRGTITQTVVPRKVQEHSLVGPSEIISVDQGHQSQQGTRIVTVHEIITTTRSDRTQQGMRGEFRNSNSPHEFGKKLSHLNSEAVKAVVLLSDPTNENIQAVRRIVAGFEDDLPGIIKGANEAAAGLKEEESKKLLDELDELCAFMNTLAATTKRSDLHDPDNLMTAQDAARKIAELSTQMCFSLDPKIKRCSKILSRSRKSFILDEKTEASLRRASFLNATDSACRAVEEAQNDLEEEYHGPRLTEDQIRDLERKTTARMGKLNAAIALLMNAHADPRNIDYEMAVNSMKTINEIMPGLIKDAKPLIANGDEYTKRKLRDQIIQLLNGTRAMCMLTGSDDISKMQNTGNDYAEASKKLIFTFNRPSRANPEGIAMHDKENEIVQLAKDVGEKVSSLLTLTNELANYDPDDPQTIDLDTAGAKCADATQGLLACTKLTAPLIQEPHCQSALTAAAENLSSSVQNVALVCKPLVEKPGRLGLAKQLADKSFDLAKALDKLKSSYAHLNNNMQTVDEDDTDMQEQKRLQFIISPNVQKDSLTDAHNQLQELIKTPSIMDPTSDKKSKNLDAQRLLSQKMAELNAAIASLLQSTADPENPDTDSAIAAIEAITKLTPNIINDTKDLHGTVNENEWNNIMKNLKDMLEATQDICAKAEDGNIEELNGAASKMAKSSGRLTFVFNSRRNSKKKDEILDLSKLAVEKASKLQPKLESLAKNIDGEEGHLLKSTGAKMIDDAERLLKTAEVTAPSIDDTRCQAALLSAIDRLSERAQQLYNSLELSSQTSQHGQSGEDINHDLKQIQSILDKLQGAVQDNSENGNDSHHGTHDDVKQRLQFIAALSRAKNAVIDADKELKDANNKPFVKSQQIEKLNVPATRNLLAERLARLNAAIANLLQATSDNERPDLEAAAVAMNTISSVTPDVIKDVKTLQGSVDDKSWAEIMEHLQSILDATNDMCSNGEDPQATSEASIRLANSVGRLTYVVSPRKKADRENQILDLSKSAVEQTSAMLSNVYQLIEDVGGDDGEKLDKAGVKVVDSAQMLLKTAEITAPSMEDDLCQEALLSAIDRLSDRARNMQCAWRPLAASPKYHQTGEHLDQNLKEVESTLDTLRKACKDVGGKENESHQRTQEQEKQRLHFNATLSRAKNAVIDADKELKDFINKPFDKSKQLQKNNLPATRNLLAERLARLNAAIANLLQATSYNESPDLEAAAAAMNTISSVTPDVIKDVKTLQGSVDDKSWAEIMEHLQSILDATNDMCSNGEDPQATSEASIRLANSVGRLTYVVSPRKKVDKENQILDLSKSAVEQTSAMLSNVYQLIEDVGGDDGEKLDKAGVKVVDSAQMLLKTAEITAPSMEDDLCQEALLSAIDRLSDRARNMQCAWRPLAASPKYHQTGEHLDQNLKEVESTLDTLRKACKDIGGKENESHQRTQEQEKQRLHFNATLSRAKNAVIDADKELKDFINKPFDKSKQMQKHNLPATRNLLTERLARLNAATANLLQATSDKERPNLEAAAAAINTISSVTPDVIKDVKTLQGSVDDKSWAEIMENLKSILDATKDMCSSSEDPQAITNSSMKLANSVGRLTYVINPRKNVEKGNQILDLSKSAVEQTSGMLSNVYQLIEEVGGVEGNKLDEAGVKVVDSAQVLLKTAEITAPSMENSLCQETLLSAIDRLSDRARDLQSAWKPITASPKYHPTGNHLNQDLKEVQSTLDKLREACRAVDEDKTVKESEEEKKQRLQFVTTLSKAKSAMIEADKELKDATYTTSNVKSLKDKKNVPALRNLLSQRLAELNAAIASLLQATSDRDKPNYEEAAASINTISNLTPAIIKDAKGLQGAVDDKSWKVIMDNLKSLIESTSDLCANSENPQELSNSATKFANSAGRLTYVFNPRKNANKENQIINLAKSAVEDTSVLLSNVYQLTETIGGKDGEKLDTAGVKVVDSAKTLLKTAEVTASSVEDPRCQQALLQAIDHLSDRARDLETTWDSLTESPEHQNAREHLSNNLKQVQTTLEKLRQACQEKDLETDEQEKQHLQLIATLSDAKSAVKDAQDDLKNVNVPPTSKAMDKSNVPAAKMLLSKKMAQLNAAIADLLQATSDTVRPDYKAAAKAINNISSLTPQIVKDTKNLHGAVEDKSWKTLMDNLKTLLDSTNDVCNNVEDPQALKESASKFANAAGRLTYVFNPHSNVKKENQIQDLSRCAVEQTSLLLSNVYNLTEKVDGEEAEKLDRAGVRVVDSAQTLLRTADITSPSINDVHCQNALLASIDKLADHTKELKNTWMPLVQAPQYHSTGDQLEQNVKIVHATLDKLRKTCQDTDASKEAKPDHLLKSISEAKGKIREVEKLFSEDNMAQRAAEARNQDAGTNNKPVMERRIDLSQKLAKLNEAIARLLQAMLDRETPDYKSAENTVDIISKLTPEIVQETMALQSNLDDNSGRIIFEEAKNICDASQAICTSVEDNNLEDLNKAAIKYAQSSRKLRYVVSPRSYPNKEKTILDISRSVCERTSLMLSRVSRLAESVGGHEGENMGISGAKLGDAAHALFTNAQVLSSSIEDQNCQTALSSSADRLSKFAQDLGIFWKPVIQHPQHHQIGEQLTRDLNLLNSELDRLKESCHDNSDINDQIDVSQQQQVSAKPMKPLTKPKPPPRMEDLDNLLENIQKTVAADNKKNKVEERLLIEDTPLRQLASKIMESAKTKAESNSYSTKEREKYSRFANELANAINRLDITNAKCRDAPFDAKDKNEKALQLENAILNLQVLCIQSRQKEGQQSNIVDLMEFVDDVTSAANDLANTVKGIKHNEKDALLEIKNKCRKIQDAASKLTNPQDIGNDGNMFEDTLLIDQFTKNCDADIKEITAVINNIADEHLKRSLLHKLQTLSDSCDLLSFATKSSISNTESATLEESLQNLGLVEQKFEDILKPIEGLQPIPDNKDSLHAVQAAQSSLAAVVASGNENELPHALTCYAVHMRGLSNNKDGNYKLKEHLKKLTDILKMQIAAKNRRVVTWQEYNDGDVSTITEKILEELQSFVHDIEASEKSGVKSSEPLKTTQLIKNNDIKRLLAPNNAPELGDEKHLKEKFNQQIQKLNSTTGTIALSVHKPDSLTRSLHTASEAAIQLASIARGLKNQDPVQSKRIEEATQEMSVATYNLLKTSESVCQSSHLPESRRRLLDACRLLNDSLNNLARAATPANMQRDCNEMSRNLQLQQSFLTSEHPSCSLNYAQCLDALQSQQEVIEKLRSEKAMSRTECSSELRFVTSAICNSTEYATQSAYLLTLSSKDKENVSKHGMVDVRRIKDLADSVNKTCLQIICNDGEKEISDQQSTLKKQVDQLQEAVDDACTKIKDDEKEELTANAHQLKAALKELNNEIKTHAFEHKENRILPKTMKLMDAINKLNYTVGRIPQPNVDNDPKKAAMAKEVIDNNRNLISNTSMMLKKASLSQEDAITWSKIGSIDVIKAFETLLTCIREKGAEAGYIEAIKLDSEVPAKSFIQTQVDFACQWLRRPVVKESDKKAGVEGAENVVQMAEQMYDDLRGPEKEEMKHVIMETKQLLNVCTVKYNSDKASLLMERLKELRKMLERGVVTRVVEDFLEEEPLANLEALHKENDEKKRKFLLEKKIAELLAQLGRVTKTARFVADTGVSPRQELLKTSDQVELLAPALVKAAEQRIHRPDDQAAIEHYQKLLAEYADSLSRVRELCDRAVDPIDFSQAAGETMHRIKEESMDDPHKSVLTSKIIMKLCNRVIDVGINSQNVKKDPELKKTLIDIKRAVDAKCEVKKADWRDVTAEFMRRTGEVESVLGGENIFLKQPDPDQPIYAAALDLHAAVRDWSARDNDIVAVAKRMAVLMARLSEHMNTGRKQELIYTSNSIVNESKEVAALAKKMALECSDIRIRTNLLQVCDRIPTISGQLKMLTTVKSSSLGHQDSTEDKEAMNMLVGNAQNLMISIQEVVKAAASASVKIMSQRGYKMKWRRRNYY